MLQSKLAVLKGLLKETLTILVGFAVPLGVSFREGEDLSGDVWLIGNLGRRWGLLFFCRVRVRDLVRVLFLFLFLDLDLCVLETGCYRGLSLVNVQCFLVVVVVGGSCLDVVGAFVRRCGFVVGSCVVGKCVGESLLGFHVPL